MEFKNNWYIEKENFRKVYIFKYGNRFFKCWEPQIGHLISLETNPEETIEMLLLEYNNKLPKLNERQLMKFTDSLFSPNKDDLSFLMNNESQTSEKDGISDFHIVIWQIMKELNQGYFTILKMPVSIFFKFVNDLWIIVWSEEYDKEKRWSKNDIKSLKNDFKEFINN